MMNFFFKQKICFAQLLIIKINKKSRKFVLCTTIINIGTSK